MSEITFDRAPRFAELSEWLHQLAADHPDLMHSNCSPIAANVYAIPPDFGCSKYWFEMMAQKSFDYFDLVGLQALPAYSIKSG